MFTSQPKAVFYDTLFLYLDLSEFEQQKKKIGRTGYPVPAMICAFVVMKCKGFGYITDLVDYLENNRIIIYYFYLTGASEQQVLTFPAERAPWPCFVLSARL